MIDEDQYRIALMEMRKQERLNLSSLQKLQSGRPRAGQGPILQIMTKDMTVGDIQTALRKEYDIKRTTAQISATLCQMKKAGRVKMVEKIVGLVIWRKV